MTAPPEMPHDLPQAPHAPTGDPIQKDAVLRDVFGFNSFRPGQEEVVDTLLSGQDALAIMPTGSGKSLCYQVPALALGGLTVVVSPLVALMEDQVAALRLAGVPAETINSSREREVNVAAWRRVAAGEVPLLYLSPERLMTGRMLTALGKLPVRLIAIDEAHCISQWGPAFRPEYADLAKLKEHFPRVPLGAFTATADAVTRKDIAEKLFGRAPRTFVAGFDRPNIRLAVELKSGWKDQLLRFLESRESPEPESGIVYCLSRKKTEEAAAFLETQGYRALPYHAGMSSEDRAENQNRFLTEDGIIIVATIAFGMGIDKPDVRFVFHTDLPGSVEAYYQEIGRAGRDGAPADAHMLYGLQDLRTRRMFIDQEESDRDRKRREHKRLDALVGYCETPRCRRQVLLGYFGDETWGSDPERRCDSCDNCLNPVELLDGSEPAKKLLRAIRESGELYGVAHLIAILRGSESEKIFSANHDQLPSYGTGAEHSAAEWRSIARQLVAAGFLRIDIEGYGGLKTTPRSRALYEGEIEFHYRPDVVAKARKRRSGATPREAANLSSEERTLLAALKQRRLELAKEREVPAFVIFSDRSLEDMAQKAPTTTMAFSDVHGVGAAKLKDLSETFLEVIRNHSTV
ncbi:MAG: DNA helicase RecQ [Acidobacteriota bacterium]